MHIVISAYRLDVKLSSNAAEKAILAPVTPSGWPIAMLPPLGLILGSSSFKPQARMQAILWAANASLSSMTSMSDMLKPALARARLLASTGPMPIIRGSTPTTAELRIRANGLRWYFLIASADAIIVAAAPSFKPEEFPAVTLPFLRNAALSFPNPSIDVLGLINSSCASRVWPKKSFEYISTRFSAVSPIASVPYISCNLGLTKRHPKLESYILESVP